jgi:hypothetical protein
LLGQRGWQRLSDETSGATIVSSVLLMLEARRNLVRLAREGTLDSGQYKTCIDRVDEDVELFALRELTLELCTSTTVPAVLTPRSLDLAHLRTALWFHASDPLQRFVTLDEAQQQAAKELGLPV